MANYNLGDNSRGFPGNCGLSVLTHVGEEPALYPGYYYSQKYDDLEAKIKKFIKNRLINGETAVVITTLRCQTHANEVLTKMGFYATPWMVRYPGNPDRDSAVWVYPLREISENQD